MENHKNSKATQNFITILGLLLIDAFETTVDPIGRPGVVPTSCCSLCQECLSSCAAQRLSYRFVCLFVCQTSWVTIILGIEFSFLTWKATLKAIEFQVLLKGVKPLGLAYRLGGHLERSSQSAEVVSNRLLQLCAALFYRTATRIDRESSILLTRPR